VDFAATSRQIGKKDLWLALFALAILPGSRANRKLSGPEVLLWEVYADRR
jgi:hypothetical protein